MVFIHKMTCREIHSDMDEKWYYELNGNVPEWKPSFFLVLLHEIGQTLSLGHSNVTSAIMYPFYQQSITNLDDEDKMAMEALYGRVQVSEQSSTTKRNMETSTTQHPITTKNIVT